MQKTYASIHTVLYISPAICCFLQSIFFFIAARFNIVNGSPGTFQDMENMYNFSSFLFETSALHYEATSSYASYTPFISRSEVSHSKLRASYSPPCPHHRICICIFPFSLCRYPFTSSRQLQSMIQHSSETLPFMLFTFQIPF